MNTTNQTHWKEQAAAAIKQGQSLNDFVTHCHPNNRKLARKAYNSELKTFTCLLDLARNSNVETVATIIAFVLQGNFITGL